MHINSISKTPRIAGIFDIRTGDVQEAINILTLIQDFFGPAIGDKKETADDAADDTTTEE